MTRDEHDGSFRINAKWIPEISPRNKRWLSIAFIAAVVAEASFLLVQDIKVFRTKSAKDISLAAVIILIVTNILWIAAALLILRDYGVLLSGILYVGFGSALLAGVVMYGDN
jgi:uncharacterized protein with PQ loop repeat